MQMVRKSSVVLEMLQCSKLSEGRGDGQAAAVAHGWILAQTAQKLEEGPRERQHDRHAGIMGF